VARRPIRPQNVSAPTRILLSEELGSLGEAKLAVPHFTTSFGESPQSARFRIGVSPRGEVRFCFPINSSGDPALDEQARRHLVLARFLPASRTTQGSDESLVWGIATFEWGNDVAHPQPASTASPAP
jgi:hypothetical protein